MLISYAVELLKHILLGGEKKCKVVARISSFHMPDAGKSSVLLRRTMSMYKCFQHVCDECQPH